MSSVRLAALLLASLHVLGPPPAAPLPATAPAVARALVTTDAAVRGELDAWAPPRTSTPPAELTLQALYEQRMYRLLAKRPSLARATFPLLPTRLAAHARDVIAAHADLFRLTPPLRVRVPRLGRAAPPDDLMRWYAEAQRRFKVPWNVLAAVNFVESAFGKLRSASAAGAQGPMQFMPSSWRMYGLGGNVHDPHDAILGAANYLRAAGARTSVRRALYAYNPSALYVDAVSRYARQIASDRHVFYELYSWQVYVRTRSGARRVTGPGLQSGQSPTR